MNKDERKKFFGKMKVVIEKIDKMKKEEANLEGKILAIDRRKVVRFTSDLINDSRNDECVDVDLSKLLKKKAIDVLKVKLTRKILERERFEKRVIAKVRSSYANEVTMRRSRV